jgi:competence ComEA-like helix-hairpin-helix protein
VRGTRPLLVLFAATLLWPATAQGQGSSKGLFSITPARREIEGKPPKKLVPTDVFNGTQQTFDVKVFPVLLTQNLDGAFDFTENPADLRKAQLTVSVSPDTFVMGPGASKRVAVSWDNIERGAYESYIGLVFQGTPRNNSGGVGNILRLLSINLLGLPNRPAPRGKFDALTVQSVEGKLHFLADVRNTGKVVGRPEDTKLYVRDSAGKVVLREDWNGDLILPGVLRRFDIPTKKVLQKGDYTAVAKMRFGASGRQSISTKFTLVGPNQLPTAQLSIGTPLGSGELGQQPHIHAVVSNTGTAPAGTRASVTLFSLVPTGPKELETKKLTIAPLQPKTTRNIDLDMGPPLKVGQYRVRIRYRDATGALQEVSGDFAASKPIKKKKTSSNLPVIVVGVLGLLLLLLLLLWLIRRQRRMRRRLEELEAAKATTPDPAPAPPVEAAPADVAPTAAAGAININTASLEELRTLPGVGPKAAERIVAHREEYGDFASLDDLKAVEGFGEARIDALRERATT